MPETASPPAPAHDAHGTDDRFVPAPWSILALVCVAQFMVILDITVVNVALPSIRSALHFAASDLAWVVTSYVLCAGGLLMLGGRAADLIGRRRIFLAGLTVFTAASLASGLAGSPAALIASRTAQGIGAAMLTPGALAIVVTTYVGPQHVRALTIWGTVASAGAAFGLLLGGMLTAWIDWRAIFFINVPVGAIAGLLALRIVPSAPGRGDVRRQLDAPGGLTLIAGLVALIYALQRAPQNGWGSTTTVLLLLLAVALLAAFVAIERVVPRPLVPPHTWQKRNLVSGAALMLGSTGVLAGALFLNSLYLQGVLHHSALRTGLEVLPLALAISAAAQLVSYVLPYLGTRLGAALGLGLIAAGSALLAAAPDHASYWSQLLPGFVVTGLGIGFVFPSVSLTVMHKVDREGAGLASGVMMTAHETGAALGLGVLSAIAITHAGLAVGFGRGFLASAIGAGALALVTLVVLPSIKPPAGQRVSLH